MAAEEQDQACLKKRNLDMNSDTLLSNGDQGGTGTLKRSRIEVEAKSSSSSVGGGRFEEFSDFELDQRIKSGMRTYMKLGKNLSDQGGKLLGNVRMLEAERERQKAHGNELAVKEIPKPSQPRNPSTIGVSDISTEETPSSKVLEEVEPAQQFGSKDENASTEIEKHSHSTSLSIIRGTLLGILRLISGASDGPEQETPSSPQAHEEPDPAQQYSESNEQIDCELTNVTSNKFSFARPDLRYVGSEVSQQSVKGQPRESPSPFLSRVNHHHPVGGQTLLLSSTYLSGSTQNLLSCFNKNDSALLPNGSSSQKDPAIVVGAKDESKLMDMSQEDELSEYRVFCERMREAKILYPSSEDPDAIEICYTDIKCLAPANYMSSTIMNFYIQFLKQKASATSKEMLCNYHFCNTYFYTKLSDAVSYKGNDKVAFFTKFRRWWKGVSIFEKVYMLIPIHENFHWSLVIICMPDKEDDAGPIVLHLDSLGLHKSNVIFHNIKSYLIEEWNFLKQECSVSDIPFADSIWKNLPRRIYGIRTQVPQQKNEYDCGLFVLYFMELFIQEAPGRLKKEDLAMFGKQWFKPQEASSLRRKIQTLLTDELENSSEVRILSPNVAPG